MYAGMTLTTLAAPRCAAPVIPVSPPPSSAPAARRAPALPTCPCRPGRSCRRLASRHRRRCATHARGSEVRSGRDRAGRLLGERRDSGGRSVLGRGVRTRARAGCPAKARGRRARAGPRAWATWARATKWVSVRTGGHLRGGARHRDRRQGDRRRASCARHPAGLRLSLAAPAPLVPGALVGPVALAGLSPLRCRRLRGPCRDPDRRRAGSCLAWCPESPVLSPPLVVAARRLGPHASTARRPRAFPSRRHGPCRSDVPRQIRVLRHHGPSSRSRPPATPRRAEPQRRRDRQAAGGHARAHVDASPRGWLSAPAAWPCSGGRLLRGLAARGPALLLTEGTRRFF